MPKPSTPAVWASNKAFSFTPNAQQIAQGFDYIATIGRPEGAPITDDHDWPFNQVTAALKWIMDQLPDGGLKYGCPLVGALIHWPLQQMPQEIWPDCGMVFIPYIGQAFDGVRYPLLKQMHPSGSLPADMRGEFARGWDNGRGVDSGRVLMSAQAATIVSAGDTTNSSPAMVSMFNNSDDDYGRFISSIGGEMVSSVPAPLRVNTSSINTSAAAQNFIMYTRSRNIAWNMIVRAA